MKQNQLILGVSLRDTATFSNYFAGKNSHLVRELMQSAEGRGERIIYFYGASGLGRTHLLQAACHAGVGSVYLPLAEWRGLSPAVLEGLESRPLICIDDVHQIAGQPEWEEALFHAFNCIRDAGSTLFVTASVAPSALPLALPDLVSRLAWGMVFQLQPLSDIEKISMLIMRAERRGMTLSEEVARFILTHCPRHMSTLCMALDVLDRTSLTVQRRLTIPFVKNVLEI